MSSSRRDVGIAARRPSARSCRNRPSLSFMMLALCTAVTRLRPCFTRVVEGELRDARRRRLGDDLQALDHARHHLVLEPGVEVLGVLADDDEVDVLVARRHRRDVPHRPQVGVEVERLAQPTLTLVKPPPIGVVTGPLSATLLRRIESSSSSGSVAPCASSASTPARCDSHSTSRPAVSRILTTAPVTSGPMPSPGMSVMVCFTWSPIVAAPAALRPIPACDGLRH